MLITLEPHGVFFYQVLHTNACQHYLTNAMCNREFAKHHFSQLWSVSENAHNSWIASHIWIKMFIFILTLSSHVYAKWGRDFVEHHFGWSRSFHETAHYSWTAPYIMIKFYILYIFVLKLAEKMTKKWKKETILVTSELEPLCVRLLDYKKAP